MESKAKKLPKRSEIATPDTWRLEDIFATDDAWEQEYKEIKATLPQFTQFQGKLGSSANILFQALQTRDQVSERLGKVFVYARMRYDQDTTNSHYQAYNDRAASLMTEASNAMSYYRPEILAIPEEKVTSFVKEHEKLSLYGYELEILNRFRSHTLSEKEESLLAQASEVLGSSSRTFSYINNADIKFPSILDEKGEEVEITHGRYIQLLENKDPRVRKEAFQSVYETYGKLRNTLASTLSGQVKKQNLIAKIRHYGSARQKALHDNQIPESVYDQLIETVHEHLPLLYRYFDIRKKALGLEELHLYDLFVPLTSELEMKVSYEEAKELLLKGLHPLGDEYLQVLQTAFDNRWVDVYENQGKRSGAYSFGTYGTNPYILMNWQNSVDNLFTLAHEFGHSVHSYYTRKTQPHVYGDYSIFVAEVASTCNENLLNDYLLKNTTDPQKRLYLITHHLDKFRSTIVRQTMFAEFELLIHQKDQAGEALTADVLSQMYYDLNKKYFGEGVVIDPEIALEWARIPHFYYNFYVYQYSTGISAATALSKQILEEGQPAVDRYLDFLKAGSSQSPIDILKHAGVDMNSPEPIREAFVVFKEYLDELEMLLGQK
ncbi:oligoendopeptidase F [Thermoactinomyces sp. DSM 45892]|uniref:oligoendopeptidase F n=1 Tax=Thermoactinomyces sp. DSM 45892 TaxID=1882753 RepID=UPI00089767B9|nr:oligoendopeptidase F [Thermoactinomyces sp. DSM 45892]SDY56948.1 oligopeptidase F. Metallo peptidase. MEROPS family M03B [Thermoactinomyces sp. DSM 45892]